MLEFDHYCGLGWNTYLVLLSTKVWIISQAHLRAMRLRCLGIFSFQFAVTSDKTAKTKPKTTQNNYFCFQLKTQAPTIFSFIFNGFVNKQTRFISEVSSYLESKKYLTKPPTFMYDMAKRQNLPCILNIRSLHNMPSACKNN